MTSYTQAAKYLKKYIQTHEGLVKAAKVLDQLGSIEQAKDVVEARVEQYKADEAKAKANLDDLNEKAANVKAETTKRLHEAEAAHTAVVNNTRAHQAQADKALAEAVAKTEDTRNEYATLLGKIAAIKSSL